MAVTDQCFPPYLGYFFFRGFSSASASVSLFRRLTTELQVHNSFLLLRKAQVREIIDFSFQDTFRSVLSQLHVEIKPSTY